MATEMHTVRWGIVATGMISEWFVSDILLPSWPSQKAHHIVQAIGSSRLSKTQKFAEQHIKPKQPNHEPSLYGSYAEVYADKNVDCVYIGTPHSFHKRNCLDAINAGKHVLCEKPFTMTAKEAEEVFAAAKEKGVFIMEAMWTRFYPLVKTLQKLLHEEQKLGTLYRTFCDFGLDIDIASLPPTSRYKDPALGAGSLLDVGIYSLTWGLVTMAGGVGEAAEDPRVASAITLSDGIEVASSVLLDYLKTGRQAICTSTTNFASSATFARIEGSKGHITVSGSSASSPQSFTFYPKDGGKEEKYEFEKPGMGFWWEADAVAVALRDGKTQDETMPWAETLRVMRIMDGVRRRGGARFPGDEW